MKGFGIVTAVDKNRATVKVDKKDECSKCGMCLFPKGANAVEFNAKNDLDAKVGDKVLIETEKDGKLIGAILAFLVPLILIGVSALIGYLVIKSEIWILILSLVLIIAWYVVLSLIDKKIGKTVSFSPKIIKIINITTEKTKGE
ncbi:MAG: SoxR reducing system RseC family protein [Clostridia bacterium]|nr:SoxR reducing system RseC family protein [Clostridia bacterium]